GRGLRVVGSIRQPMSRRSSKETRRPFRGSSLKGHQLCLARAQATWREPWPWQASQPTLIAAQVVAKRSVTASDTESHWSELVRPLTQSGGHDAPRSIDELVPGLATMVDKTVV